MKTIKYIASLLAGITLFSCDNFEDINTNPDAVTKVSPKAFWQRVPLSRAYRNLPKAKISFIIK